MDKGTHRSSPHLPKTQQLSGISKDKYTARLYQGKPYYGIDSMIPLKRVRA